jgi:lipopolysaccharide exporter
MNGVAPPEESLTTVARRAVLHSGLSVLVVGLAQILYTGLTSRVLGPAAFGTYAVATSISTLASYFALNSLSLAVFRHLDAPRGLLRQTSIRASVAGGLSLGAVVLVSAHPLASAFGNPHAAPEVRTIAGAIALLPVSAVTTALLRLERDFKVAAIAEAASSLLGMAAGVLLVLTTRVVLALILAQVVANGSLVIMGLLRLRSVHRVASKTESYIGSLRREMITFASIVGFQNLASYGIYTLPVVVVARHFGVVALGLYSRATVLIALPLTQIVQTLNKVFYPLLLQVSDPARKRNAVTDILIASSFTSAAFFSVIGGLSEPVVHILLGNRFGGSVSLVRGFALFGIVNLPTTLAGTIQESHRHLKIIWVTQGLQSLILGLSLLIIVESSSGLIFVVLAVCGTQIVAHAIQLATLRRKGLVQLSRIASGYAQSVTVATIIYLGLGSLTEGVQSNIGKLLVASGYLPFVAALLWLARSRLAGLSILMNRR